MGCKKKPWHRSAPQRWWDGSLHAKQAGFPEDLVEDRAWARDRSGQTFTPHEPHEIWEVYVCIFLYVSISKTIHWQIALMHSS